ncbi:MAG: Ig-like domain-containing protein [Candidatus Bathyarchaeia archaeon]
MSKLKGPTMLVAVLIGLIVVVLIYAPSVSGCTRRDRKPPKIHWVMQHPQIPDYEDNVLVLAYVTDFGSGVANATIYCTVNDGQTIKIAMSRNGSLFFAEIPALPYNSTVAYRVCAYDKAGNKACSGEHAYVVGDFHPPVITFIQQFPFQPSYNDTVTVFANATEPADASGVKELRLTYWNGGNWTTIVMEPYGTLYKATIPEFPYGTTVQYKVSAVDHAGNTLSLDVYSYNVEDKYVPVAMFQFPKNGSFVSKTADVTFYLYDDNFCTAKLMFDGTVLASLNQTCTYTYELDTTMFSDGVHELKLEAVDKAGNKVENVISITVDNTAPTAEILRPLDKSFVRGLVLIEVQAGDANFESIELKIETFGKNEIKVWNVANQIYAWNTTEFGDGECRIVLAAVDKAGNKAEKQITVTVDNTAPKIDSVTWTPETPTTNKTVTVYAEITEEGSGIENVFLWFRRLGKEWQKTSMSSQEGNWTAVIPGFEEGVTVTFLVECADKSGNVVRSTESFYVVKAVIAEGFTGIPLHWLALAVLAIFAILASTAYYLKGRKRATSAKTFLVSSI